MKLANLEEGESIPNTPPGGKGGAGQSEMRLWVGVGVSEWKMEANLQRKAGGGANENRGLNGWMDEGQINDSLNG